MYRTGSRTTLLWLQMFGGGLLGLDRRYLGLHTSADMRLGITLAAFMCLAGALGVFAYADDPNEERSLIRGLVVGFLFLFSLNVFWVWIDVLRTSANVFMWMDRKPLGAFGTWGGGYSDRGLSMVLALINLGVPLAMAAFSSWITIQANSAFEVIKTSEPKDLLEFRGDVTPIFASFLTTLSAAKNK